MSDLVLKLKRRYLPLICSSFVNPFGCSGWKLKGFSAPSLFARCGGPFLITLCSTSESCLRLTFAMANMFSLRRIEGSHACAKLTAELLRQVVSHQRVPYTSQAAALVDAVKAVGEKLISANPVGMSVTLISLRNLCFWSSYRS